MGQYRYVGGAPCEVHGFRKFELFGESFEAPDALKFTIADGSGVIIPEDRWQSLLKQHGLTDQDLKPYQLRGQRIGAPANIQEFVHDAWAEYHEFVTDLRASEVTTNA